MATLIFSTVGQALGGPIGGAIGALIGQSIDQQLLGGSARGPRLGDLKVQSSSYGSPIPRVYGAMRVAGTVVWATDLTEGQETSGAKGQPDTVYSYSVSMAVALTSRAALRVGRIWADGKLLRGADGEFKVNTKFRFYSGSEDQQPDGFIGSYEGIGKTPAYRGLALAVFEDLELAEYGNRIPFLTFEIFADEGPVTTSSILRDATCGIVECGAVDQLGGYAAYGRSMKAAVQPLLDCYAIDLFDDGEALVEASQAPRHVTDADLANSADRSKAARMQREQRSVRSLPSIMRLGYYDSSLDYQAGEARAASAERLGIEEQRELPAVISAADAKALAHQMVARAWAQRDRLTVRLPTRFLDLQPGSRISLDLTPHEWTVEQCTIDGFVAVAELRPAWKPAAPLAADAGRIVAARDVMMANVELALLEVPGLFANGGTSPQVMLAASSASPGWKSCAAQILAGSQSFGTQTASRKTVLGEAVTALPSGATETVDTINSVDVQLIDQDQWLVSADEAALAEGVNLAMLGGELVQFGTVEPLGEGRFRLSQLLRGRERTEAAISTHVPGEIFVLLQRDSLRTVELPQWAIGAPVKATARNVDGSTSESAVITIAGPQREAIPLPDGGDVVDDQARASIEQILSAMRQYGMVAA